MTEGIISFAQWQELDLRVAQIVNVEEIANADKLWKLTLDVGEEIGERVVCAGIKEHYSKEELEGKKIILFVNLTPRVMKGIESQGMLLAAVSGDDSDDGKDSQPTHPEEQPSKERVVLLTPEKDIEVGAKVQ